VFEKGLVESPSRGGEGGVQLDAIAATYESGHLDGMAAMHARLIQQEKLVRRRE